MLAGAQVPAFVQEATTMLLTQEIKGGLNELFTPPKDVVAIKELRNQLEEGNTRAHTSMQAYTQYMK